MNRTMNLKYGLACWILAGLPAFGGTIVSVSGPLAGGRPLTGSGTHVAVSWSSAATFTDVQISALLGSFTTLAGSGNVYAGTAYLTTQIGPGTTAANEIAQSPFTFPGDPPFPGTLLTLFSGLTLGPGSYFLVLTGQDVPLCDSGIGCGLWNETTNPTLLSDPGISNVSQWFAAGPGYAPGLVWNSGATSPYRSVFSVSSVPEPTSLMLMLAGVAAIGTRRWRTRR